jgi:phosphatidylserine/phosphatidylglycerophosphate/cardiolipin synthase-like enzyme
MRDESPLVWVHVDALRTLMRERTVQPWPASPVGKIEAYIGPPELGAADDLEQVIVEFIRGAKSSLDIAVQEVDSRAIAQAILDARWRGVRVNIFLEQDYLRSDLVGTRPRRRRPSPERPRRRPFDGFSG